MRPVISFAKGPWPTSEKEAWLCKASSAFSLQSLFAWSASHWTWLKIKQEGLHRCWSMFPLTRVPFWYRFFEPQPFGFEMAVTSAAYKSHRGSKTWRPSKPPTRPEAGTRSTTGSSNTSAAPSTRSNRAINAMARAENFTRCDPARPVQTRWKQSRSDQKSLSRVQAL